MERNSLPFQQNRPPAITAPQTTAAFVTSLHFQQRADSVAAASTSPACGAVHQLSRIVRPSPALMEDAVSFPALPTSPTPSKSQGTRQRPTLWLRACQRCQRRKIRCDGAIPSCGSCSKAGTDCVDKGTQQNLESPRAYFSTLQNRVRWLESVIRTRCPDVNLNEGPQVVDFDTSQHTPAPSQADSWPSTITNQHHNVPQQSSGLDEYTARHEEQPPKNDDTSREQSGAFQHEIGLISLSAGTDPKYIGPSSGYSFARLLLACAARQGQSIRGSRAGIGSSNRFAFLLPHDPLSTPPMPLPTEMSYTMKLSTAYFETIHIQYPFLHQPSHVKLIQEVYAQPDPNPVDAFQVNMVLAIASTVLSRRLKVPLPSAAYCANAMKYFDKIHLENSLRGLQSLLLLLVYTLNSPSLGLNVWYLNYQCIAALLDLGLQRDVRSGKAISVLEQEMRTRTFWVIYSLDRAVATMMGRPIGLRDEACEFRLPADVDDSKLSTNTIHTRQAGDNPTHMSCAIHLFKLAQIISEIKYICHSISHKVPPHSYPNVPDLLEWQRDVLARLATLAKETPQFSADQVYMTRLCEIQHHRVVMLLLSPTPAIPSPSTESFCSCYESAVAVIRLYDQQYKQDLLVYSWVVVHSIFLSTITMLHCIWTVPVIASRIQVDDLVAILKSGSNVLSATAEYWPEARRSRDVLDSLSTTTVRWLLGNKSLNLATSSRTNQNDHGHRISDAPRMQLGGSAVSSDIEGLNTPYSFAQSADLILDNQSWDSDLFSSVVGNLNFADNIDYNDPATINAIMQGVLSNENYHVYDNEHALAFLS